MQLSLFEPRTSACVEVTELYGQEPGGVFRLLDNNFEEIEIETCWGDIVVMCNALEDYANMLESVIPEWKLDGVRKAMYEYHAKRCRKISLRYQEAIGYNYRDALINCAKMRNRKDDDAGEDALILANRKKKG